MIERARTFARRLARARRLYIHLDYLSWRAAWAKAQRGEL